jgi:superfamily II DNA or RNA helicase
MATTYSITRSGNAAIVQPWTPAVEALATATVLESKTPDIPWAQLAQLSHAERRKLTEQRVKYELFTRDPDGKWGMVFGGLVPRIASSLRSRGSIVTLAGEPVYPPVDFTGIDVDWRERQKESVAALLASPGGVFQAAPGFGKSLLLGVCCKLLHAERIMVVVSGRALLGQTAQRLREAGLEHVGHCDGARLPKATDRIIVCSSKSLHKIHENWPTVLFFDEVHQAGALTCALQLARFQHARMFGLSATPFNRGDGASLVVEAVFGPAVVKITQQEAQDLGCVLPVEVRMLRYEPGLRSTWQTDVAITRFGLWRNSGRNQLIAQAVRALQAEGFPQIMVTVATVEHAMHLRALMPEFKIVRGPINDDRRKLFEEQGLWRPEDEITPDNDKLRELFSQQALRWVLATKTWWTGVDFPNLRVVVRADGESGRIAAEQIGGRVARVLPGTVGPIEVKTQGTMVDVMDLHNDFLMRKSDARLRHYRDIGWTVRHWAPTQTSLPESPGL